MNLKLWNFRVFGPLRDAKAELSEKRNSRLSHSSFQDKKGHRFLKLVRALLLLTILIFSACKETNSVNPVFLNIPLGATISSIDTIVQQNYLDGKLGLTNNNFYYYTFTGLTNGKFLYARLHAKTTDRNVTSLLLKVANGIAYIEADGKDLDQAPYPLSSQETDAIIELYKSKYGKPEVNKAIPFGQQNEINEMHYIWSFPDKNYQILIAVADEPYTTRKFCMVYYELKDKKETMGSKQDI